MKPKPIPFSTRPDVKDPDTPNVSGKDVPEQSPMTREQPVNTELTRETPEQSPLNREAPVEPKMDKPLPEPNKENYVTIGDKEIELKSTPIKYFRNRMASTFSVLRVIPLNELVVYGKGVLDESRNGDQLLFDFLVAAFDDLAFVRANYDNMTADEIEQVFKIFGRVNHIDEKEEQQRKNREAQAKR